MIFIAKFGCAISFLGVYQVSFSDMTLFPSAKRATAIGICQIFARGITILAPEFAELPKPLPVLIVCAVAVIALITVSTFEEDVIIETPSFTPGNVINSNKKTVKKQV